VMSCAFVLMAAVIAAANRKCLFIQYGVCV
jgi:hypothetical protein